MAAGETDVIKSFLVGLGFDIDQSSLAAFNKSIATAALRVTALYTSVSAFAGSMVYAFSKISEGFEEMGYQYHIIAPAINKAIVLRNELMKAYSAAGINIRKVIVDSVNLNMSLTKTKYAMEAIYKSVGSKFFGLLTAQSDAFRKRLYQNMPYIIKALEKLVSTVFKAFEIVVRLGERLWSILSRVVQIFIDLDEKTNGWSTIVIGLLAAWKLLNLEFLATPLGMLIAGFVSLLALWDDFKTYQEGGKSLINWGPWIPIINAVKDALDGVFGVLFSITKLLVDIWNGDGWAKVKADVLLLTGYFKDLGGAVNNIFSGIGDRVSSLFGGGGGAAPLGSNTNNSSNTKINANMQTSILVQGSPNADAVGRSVAAQQANVNADMTRNMKGVFR